MNLLESLKRCTTVVADTGDIEAIAEHKPQDATTNPSLLFQAAQKPQYQELVYRAIDLARASPGDRAARTAVFMDSLLVGFGCEILKIVPGRVSTEVDAGLSFDTAGTLEKAHRLIELYRKAGSGRACKAFCPDREVNLHGTWGGFDLHDPRATQKGPAVPPSGGHRHTDRPWAWGRARSRGSSSLSRLFAKISDAFHVLLDPIANHVQGLFLRLGGYLR